MVLGIGLCNKCKEDRYRVSMGYQSRGKDCGRWQCHLIDFVNGVLIIMLLIPILLIIIPFMIIFLLIDIIGGNGYAVQGQRTTEEVSKTMGRKKSRKSNMGRISVAQRSSRTQKRTRSKKLAKT